MQQEALLFAEQNGYSAPLTAGIRLRAKVVGGDAVSEAFVEANKQAGLVIDYTQQAGAYRIGCVGTALRLYKQMDEKIYCETMRLIVAAWDGSPDSLRAAVLKGMMHFVELYHGADRQPDSGCLRQQDQGVRPDHSPVCPCCGNQCSGQKHFPARPQR